MATWKATVKNLVFKTWAILNPTLKNANKNICIFHAKLFLLLLEYSKHFNIVYLRYNIILKK